MATTPTSPTSRQRAGPAHRSRGYTLVELLVVLAILALMATLATPMIGRGEQTGLRATAEDIGSELRAARGRALHANQATSVAFDTGRGQVLTPSEGVVATLPDGVAMRVVVADSEQASSTTGRVRFFPDGSSTGGHITLLGAERQIAVDVDWFDGRTEVGDATTR